MNEDGKRMQEELDAMEKAMEEPKSGFESSEEADNEEHEKSAEESEESEKHEDSEKSTSEPEKHEPEEPEADESKAEETESVTEEAESEEQKVDDEELRKLRDELAARDAELSALRAKYESKTDTSSEEEEQKQEDQSEQAKPPEIPDENFLDDIDFDDLSVDSEVFNQLLNKIYKKARLESINEIRQHEEMLIRSIPDIVRNNLAVSAKLKEVHDKFYSDNEDLVPFKRVVGAVFEELIAENPDKSYEELLPQLSTDVRSRLNLYKNADKSNESDEVPPKLPRAKGGHRQVSKPDTDPLLKELDEMDKALGID